jgi:RNA polymerase sigma-70 factor, ECF subfamily
MIQSITKRFLEQDIHILIAGCRRNELQSQQRLYRLYYPDMIKICFRYAKDADGAGTIYNDAMLKVFRSIGQYTDMGNFTGWIKTIVIHCCIDHCRKKDIFQQSVPYFPEEESGLRPEAFDRISGKEIQAFIRTLPQATATVFNLYVYEGFTHKQIGEALQISDGTSKWHFSEARKLLRKRLEQLSNQKIKINAAG